MRMNAWIRGPIFQFTNFHNRLRVFRAMTRSWKNLYFNQSNRRSKRPWKRDGSEGRDPPQNRRRRAKGSKRSKEAKEIKEDKKKEESKEMSVNNVIRIFIGLLSLTSVVSAKGVFSNSYQLDNIKYFDIICTCWGFASCQIFDGFY